MNRRLIFCLFFCFSIILGCGCGDVQVDNRFKKDAFYYNKLIGTGINLGNALEAPQEGQWGVVLQQEYFELIKQAGFNSVRIPIKWSAHAGQESPYLIEESFFQRVDWAVNQAISRGLVTIINVHHYDELMDKPKLQKERFLRLWEQIAQRYKDHSELLYFELLNEPCKNLFDSLWNNYLNQAIEVIRESNPGRTIVVGSAEYNSISGLKYLRLPRDDSNIIVTFHYYNPFPFTHQGAQWVSGSDAWLSTKWTATFKEQEAVSAELDKALEWAKKENRPLFMGEFGAYSKADMSSRVRWTSFVRKQAQKRKISFAYWEFCSGFGVYDSETKMWRKSLLNALVDKGQPQ